MKQLHIKMRAQNPAQNIDRTYEIVFDRGLFESYVVLIGWGRVNARGKQESYVFYSHDDAQKFIQMKVKKRLNAKKRIGCDYEMVSSS